MSNASTDAAFSGSIPKIYQQFLVPLIFQIYADDLAARVASRSPERVLELAAGTGVVTRSMAATLPASADIVATDLNPAMLSEAQALHANRAVEWRQVDATSLPFDAASFDVVVCQFGVMFFPDRPAAYAEARRVLRPGGAFLFNVWGSLEDNEFARIIHEAMHELFPDDPPSFLGRAPYGYFDHGRIQRDLTAGGFGDAPIDVVDARSRAANAHIPAVGYCQGTPLRMEIEARDPKGLGTTTERVTRAIERELGTGRLDTRIRAHVVTAAV